MDPGTDCGSETPNENDIAIIHFFLYLHSLCQVSNIQRHVTHHFDIYEY